MVTIVASAVSLITLAVQAAESPAVAQVYADGKNIITALFKAGLIDVQTQNALMGWCDAHMNATLAGQEPPEFVVS
ncbi:MAG: hypothetical protein JWQ04_2839 [Pedosphaera sp.]|nr:hypothetical protein [Pedosphaera sp.]